MNSRFSKYVLIVALLATAAAQPACRLYENPNGAEAALNNRATELVVKSEPVKRQEWIDAVPFSGTLRSQSVVDVKTEVGGRLISVYFEEGDFVKKDRLLAEIDPVNYRLAYDQAAAALAVAEAGLERAKVAVEHARTEKERADNLLRTGGITQKDHQAAETGVKDAESQARLAEAQIGQARVPGGCGKGPEGLQDPCARAGACSAEDV